MWIKIQKFSENYYRKIGEGKELVSVYQAIIFKKS